MPTKLKVMISGVSYESGVRDLFPVKPTKERKRGLGYQMQYDLTVPELKNLVDIMAEMATPEDESKFSERVAEAVYRDMKHFPPEAGL